MKQRDAAYLTMVNTVLEVMDKYKTVWSISPPAARQVAALQADTAASLIARQGSGNTTEGITDDKEAAGDVAIDKAVLLAGLTQAYALEHNNMTLYEQMRVTESGLDNMGDEALLPRLQSLHGQIAAIGQPLEEYGVTTTLLAELETAIQAFANMRSAPRVAIGDRKRHNASLPALLRHMRLSFTILDKLVKSMRQAPAFVQEYFTARNIIGPGGNGPDAPPAA